MVQGDSGPAMTQSVAPDKIEPTTRAIEFVVHLIEEDVRARDEAPAALLYSHSTGDLSAPSSRHLRSGHSFDQDVAGFVVYAMRTILQKQLQPR